MWGIVLHGYNCFFLFSCLILATYMFYWTQFIGMLLINLIFNNNIYPSITVNWILLFIIQIRDFLSSCKYMNGIPTCLICDLSMLDIEFS